MHVLRCNATHRTHERITQTQKFTVPVLILTNQRRGKEMRQTTGPI